MHGSGGTNVNENRDQIIKETDAKPLVCYKNSTGYNCNPTNNFYNPLEF
jgi:hypothetical protein